MNFSRSSALLLAMALAALPSLSAATLRGGACGPWFPPKTQDLPTAAEMLRMMNELSARATPSQKPVASQYGGVVWYGKAGMIPPIGLDRVYSRDCL
ncbi:hypothetical protein [Sphaerisporangium sp. NPDC051011]|uniref:hypothetical protein n=1 Tax=Sphaerisporangium sp. NPDC051011 TaxID=3155792 RepID=UPI0033E291EB